MITGHRESETFKTRRILTTRQGESESKLMNNSGWKISVLEIAKFLENGLPVFATVKIS